MHKRKTLWAGNHKLSPISNKLKKLIPIQGSVKNPRKNPKLERYRKASNLYYEVFNNGCINGLPGCSAVLGVSAASIKHSFDVYKRVSDRTFDILDNAMESIIIEAAAEQLENLTDS